MKYMTADIYDNAAYGDKEDFEKYDKICNVLDEKYSETSKVNI